MGRNVRGKILFRKLYRTVRLDCFETVSFASIKQQDQGVKCIRVVRVAARHAECASIFYFRCLVCNRSKSLSVCSKSENISGQSVDSWKQKSRLRHCSYRSFASKASLCTFTGRIPSVPDPDVLRTYLANKEDTATIPKIPVRSRAFGLRTKMGTYVAFTIDRSFPRIPLN